MKTLKSFFRSLKLVAIAFVFATFILANASPAFAFGGSSSKPSDGAASLSGVQSKSDKVAKSQPRSGKEVSNVAQDGLNGVQGAADKGKMIKPSDTDATTVKDDIESGIKSVMGQD